ncbi:hypothetical protein L207DRAFT_509289 [Hyaloscypha variabilis F]|uniref:Uncharacterized protein n=1 Tax=Hyaloscypha variabilis (strain UAMH 11265 / GT02V1 / F) TaxID=1149755 RepID=A0A2J6S1C5_HYAVF|nr:hypothetical protein L207DRAFT_509289 [Hyaloscypha variabilis F]
MGWQDIIRRSLNVEMNPQLLHRHCAPSIRKISGTPQANPAIYTFPTFTLKTRTHSPQSAHFTSLHTNRTQQ